MQRANRLFPLAAIFGTTVAANLSAVAPAFATGNPFEAHSLAGASERIAAQGEPADGRSVDGKCGADTKMSGHQGKCRLERMDADHDGSVSREEFLKAHEAMFSMMDANGDGRIAGDEMKCHRGHR